MMPKRAPYLRSSAATRTHPAQGRSLLFVPPPERPTFAHAAQRGFQLLDALCRSAKQAIGLAVVAALAGIGPPATAACVVVDDVVAQFLREVADLAHFRTPSAAP